MSAQLSPAPIFQGVGFGGLPIPGGQLFTYIAGTSTPQATFTDSTQTQQNTNPVILNANGQAKVWLNPLQAYKFVLTDALGNTIYTVDQINAEGPLLGFTSILNFGAVGDGVTNNYSAFVNAIAFAKSIGTNLYIPAGNFVIDTSVGTLSCSYVTFQGVGVTDGSSTPGALGSVISITGIANSPFTIGPSVSFFGISFFYPAQVDTASPIVFPPTIVTSLAIAGAINFVTIQDCTVFNAYRFFVDTDTTGSIGHCFFENNTIYGILTCFELAYNAEIITFTGNEFTFGAYLAATEAGLRGFTRANGTVLKVIRTDGITFQGNVCFGYLNGVDFATNATICQLTSILGNYFDQNLFPISANGTGNLSNITISGNVMNAFNSQNTALVGNCIKIATSGSLALESITINGNIVSTCTGDAILVTGTAPRSLSITANQINGVGAFETTGSFGCMDISGANTSYLANGNYFTNQAGTPAVANGILGSCVDAVITGNIFGGFQAAISATFNNVTASGNLSYGTLGTFSNNYSAGVVIDVANNWDKASGTSTRPMWNVNKNASQTFAHSASGVVCTFPAITYDLAGNWNTSTSTFTAKQAGRYRFGWQLMHDNTATAADRWTFTLGVTSGGPTPQVSYKVPTPTDFNTFAGYAEIQLSVNGTVQLLVSQVGGTGNLVTFNAAASNYLCGSLVE